VPGTLDLANLNGSNGIVVNGLSAGNGLGISVGGAGDVNGDGIDDFIVGASGVHTNGLLRVGQSYVIFGDADGFPSGIDLNGLNGSNGFSVSGVDAEDGSGFSVSGAGDINGDGFDDIIIGAQRASPDGRSLAGESYVVFGGSGEFPAEISLSSLDGVNGFVIIGRDSEDEGEMRASAAGDINGDGIDDIIVGAPAVDTSNGTVANNQGESYVIFGTTDGFAAQFDLRDLDGSNGFAISGDNAGDVSGLSVSAAGDINGDGIDDIIIGAIGVGIGGAAYVVYGNDQGFAATLSLAAINGENGFVLRGLGSMDRTGQSVSGTGDVNGDGIDDIIVAAPFADPGGLSGAGTSYVIFGSAGGFPQDFNLATLDGNNGFAIHGAGVSDQSGFDVSAAGDVNGDGFDDVIIGARIADTDGNIEAGKSYIVFGSGAGFPANLNLSNLDGSNGFVVNGIAANDHAGSAVSAAGDINGDGYDDILIGAPGVGPDGFVGSGAAYVIFGSQSVGQVVTETGTAADDSLTGGGFADTLSGDAGDDTLEGGAGGDVLDGGSGTDLATYASSASAVTANLNTGVFTRGDAAGDTLTSIENLTGSAFADRLIGDVVANKLAGGTGGDTLAGGGGADTVEGGLGDDAIFAGSGDESGDLFAGGAGNDLIATGAGDDLSIGDSAVAAGLSDTTTNADGSDTLFGGSGNDTLIAGGWDDANDNNRYDAGEQQQTGSSSNIAYSGSGNDVLFGDGGDDVLGGGDGNDLINGGAGNDIFYGGRDTGSDTLSGSAGNDTLFAGGGDDSLDSGEDADELFGGGGADTLNGGAGADSLFGGGGDDLITGGTGADFFFFANNHGDDVVTDFNAAEDTLFLANTVADFTDLASVTAEAIETTVGGTAGLLIDTGGGNSVFLEGITTSDLSESNLSL